MTDPTPPTPPVPPSPTADRASASAPEPAPAPESAPGQPRPLDAARASDARAVLARKRGLPGPYITGGEDADPSAGRSEERRYGTLLVAMVVAIVLAGFVLGIVGVLLGAGTP